MSNQSFNKRYLRILSRHGSHAALRKINNGVLCNELAVVRFGSTTPSNKPIQINSIDAVKTSSDKLLMKKAFDNNNVTTPKWFPGIEQAGATDNEVIFDEGSLEYPVVAKHRFGSRGTGNTLINSYDEFINWSVNRNMSNYIFEAYNNYTKEYRVHVAVGIDNYYYSCRKMLKSDTPDNKRWYRNDTNCTWYMESNSGFDKPDNWDDITKACHDAVAAVGLDIGSVDVKVAKDGRYTIIETNSASSLAPEFEKAIRIVLPKIVNKKLAETTN